MGDKLTSIVEGAKDVLLFDQLLEKIKDTSLFKGIFHVYAQHRVLVLLAAACIFALIAFEGYKLFKMSVYGGGAFVFGLLGLWYLAPKIPETVRALIPDIIDFDALVALVCALVAVFLARFAFKFMIMILGGVAGYFLGSMYIYSILTNYFSTLDFLKMGVVKHVVGGVFAALLSILFLLLFKHIFMVLTSFGCMIDAFVFIRMMILPNADMTLKISFIVLGVAVGVAAVVRQYKEEEKSFEIYW